MAKSEKAETPLFRNRTKIDQVVYDKSYGAVNIGPGKTIRGEWYRRYTGKNGPLIMLETKNERAVEHDKDKKPADREGKG